MRGFHSGIEQREQAAAAGETPARPWGGMEARYARRLPAESSQAPEMVLRLQEQQKPTIAAVNGPAIGAGMGLALACDIRLAGQSAQFSEAFSRMGLIPADGSCWNLPRLIGISNTLLLQYTGDRIDAAEARRLGLVSKVVADADLPNAAMELAARLAQGASRSQALIKYLVRQGMHQTFREHLELAHVAQEQARATADHKEAVAAFLEKRPPVFKGGVAGISAAPALVYNDAGNSHFPNNGVSDGKRRKFELGGNSAQLGAENNGLGAGGGATAGKPGQDRAKAGHRFGRHP